jgi:tRNA (mo5U34)-methyltransferase
MPGDRLAGDPGFEKIIQDQVAYLSSKGWFHSIELPDGRVIRGFHSLKDLRERLNAFPIPQDLRGKRVLDVGAWTGWCSFELERRGAEVVAMDCVELEEFQTARSLLASRVEFRMLDVEELSPACIGLFDYVLFFGVFYHLRNPLLGLEKICSATREAAFVESYVTDGAPSDDSSAGPALLEFYETTELGGQVDNWYGPNTRCLLAMCRSAGFARVRLEGVVAGRARVSCWRRWEPPDPEPSQPAPWIHAAINSRTNDIYFHHGKDEYVCLYFKTPERGLVLGQIRAEVDGYGVPALVLADLGRSGWQVNFRIPPWLEPGAHEIRVRTPGSPLSEPYRIEKRVTFEPAAAFRRPEGYMPPEDAAATAPRLTHIESSVTETRVFQGHRNEYLICWFVTTEEKLTREDVILAIDGVEQALLFLTDLREGAWQTNSRLPAALAPGPRRVRVRTIRSAWSNAEEFTLQAEDGDTLS